MATTSYVGPDLEYKTIQSAINASADGDTIYVYGGEYHEPVNVDKKVTLIGLRNSSGGRPLMLGWPEAEHSGAYAAMNISAGGTIVDGFDFRSDCNDSYYSNYSTGILIHTNDGYMDGSGPDIQSHGPYTASGCTIRNVSITNCSTGIRIDFASETTVTDSAFIRNSVGVDVSWGRSTVVCRNQFLDSHYSSMAIDMFSPHCVIVGNNFAGYKYRPIRMVYAVGNVSANTSSPVNYTYLSQPYRNCTGNYWSDYQGFDLNNDGIGDTPYLIDVVASGNPGGGSPWNFTDEYPAMGEWSFDSGTAAIHNPTVVPTDGTDIPLSVRLHTLHVGPGQIYSTIQRAVNVSADGDTIYVHGDVYPEAVVVNKQLTLIGVPNSSGGRPLLAGWPESEAPGSNVAMKITASGVVVDGFDIRGGGIYSNYSSGIKIEGSNQQINCEIRNINVTSCNTGVLISGVRNVSIIQSVVTDNDGGVTTEWAGNITLTRNTFVNNSVGARIDLASHVELSENNFIGNFYGGARQGSHTGNIRGNSTLPEPYVFGSQAFVNYTGNFWSDYDGQDMNGDGIGDTPYVINAVMPDLAGQPWRNFTDDYPAMGRWSFENGTATIEGHPVVRPVQNSTPTPAESGYGVLLPSISLLVAILFCIKPSRKS